MTNKKPLIKITDTKLKTVLVISQKPLFTFESSKGEKAYFDYKDGKWQFWGDLEIDESAKILFDALSKCFTKEVLEKLLSNVKSPYGCIHGRPAGQTCPHCLGLNK